MRFTKGKAVVKCPIGLAPEYRNLCFNSNDSKHTKHSYNNRNLSQLRPIETKTEY